MLSLEKAHDYFKNDRFATKAAGIEIVEVDSNYAKCRMPVTELHKNAMGAVMGGALFTLADFTFAVASNIDGVPTVSLSSQISYLSPVHGDILYGEAKCLKCGKSTCTYVIDITDDVGTLVACVTATGFRKIR